MRILVVQLLRIGDILMSLPAIGRIKAQNPEAEIHLLINQQFSGVVPLLKGVDQIHYFDRIKIQSEIGQLESHILNPYYRIKSLIEDLSVHYFDQVYNFTQNKLSAYLMSALPVQNKFGLVFEKEQFFIRSQPWQRYLNNLKKDQESHFHMMDILAEGQASSYLNYPVGIKETPQGQKEYESLNLQKKTIVFQALTSDDKKNWDITNFNNLFDRLAHLRSEFEFIVLAAPQEMSKLKGINARLFECSLEGAYSAVKNASLLVTTDTSIKHLATFTKTPVVEIALGSSVPTLTSIYGSDHIILSSKVACAPCTHSKKCSQVSHLCALSVLPIHVAQAIESRIYNESFKNQEVQVHMSQYSKSNYIVLKDMNKNPLANIQNLVEKKIRHLFIESDQSDPVGISATAAYLLFEDISPMVQAENNNQVNAFLKSLLAEAQTLEDCVREFEFEFIKNKVFADDLLLSARDSGQYLLKLKQTLEEKNANQFLFYRRIQQGILETKKLIEIRKKLIRSLIEIGEEYESRARAVSDSRP